MPVNFQQVEQQIKANVDRMARARELDQALVGKSQWHPGEVLALDGGRYLREHDFCIFLHGDGRPSMVAVLHPLEGWIPINRG